MTLSHIAGCRGIRDIAGLMSSLQGSINHLGGQQAPSKSTIAYQNQHRRWEVFRDAYYAIRKSLGQQIKQGYNIPEVHRRIKLLDSTTITLSLNSFPWATYQHEKGGIKLHTVLDFEQATPDFVEDSFLPQQGGKHSVEHAVGGDISHPYFRRVPQNVFVTPGGNFFIQPGATWLRG